MAGRGGGGRGLEAEAVRRWRPNKYKDFHPLEFSQSGRREVAKPIITDRLHDDIQA